MRKQLVKVFGGDAAEQRARRYAEEHGGNAVSLDQCSPAQVRGAGLDPFYRDDSGTQFSWGVLADNND